MYKNKAGLILRGAVAGAVDGVLTSSPGIAIAWSAIKGGVNAVRTKKAEEFLQFIESNFNENCFLDGQFIEGLSLSFEYFIKERSERKRKIIQDIFLGFSKDQDKENFELERILELVRIISLRQVHALSLFQNSRTILLSRSYKSLRASPRKDLEAIRSLQSLGLVHIYVHNELKDDSYVVIKASSHDSTKNVEYELTQEEVAELSSLGKQFIIYIKSFDS